MNEQELREWYFKYCENNRIKVLDVEHLKFFNLGYSLAQETIKAKDAEIKRLNEYADQCKKFVEADCLHCDNLDKAIAEARELIIELVEGDYEFTCDCTTTREKAKAWLENNR